MFSVKDIIDIAVQIEQNGENVYRNAAAKIKDPSLCSLLQWLADEEAEHKKWFEALVDNVPDKGNFSEQGKMGTALLKNAVGVKNFSLGDADILSMETIEDLLNLAMEFEKDTILFYKMLSPLIDDQKILEQLHIIINEEEKHGMKIKDLLSESSCLT